MDLGSDPRARSVRALMIVAIATPANAADSASPNGVRTRVSTLRGFSG
jgi:hypothetical protein